MASIFNVVIKSDGTDITKKLELISINTSYFVNDIAEARLKIRDGDPAKETFKLSELPALQPGKKIEVLSGYKKGKEESIFQGIVTGLEIGRAYDNSFYLELFLNSDAIKMVDLPVNQLFDKDSTDNAIISKLMKDSGVSAGKVETSKIKHLQFFQENISAWECLMERTLVNGFLFISTPKDSQVIDPAKHKGKEHKIGITSSNLEYFNLSADLSSQIKSVKVDAWDIKNQKSLAAIEGKGASIKTFKDADKALGRKPWQIQMNLPLEKPEVTAIANAQASYRNLDLYKGSMTFLVTESNGLAAVKLGDTLKLEGFGKTFNGTVFVSAIHHVLNTSGWKVKLCLGLSLTKTIMSKYAKQDHSRFSTSSGLVIATVAKFEKDPQQLSRIPVILPGLSGDKKVWARLTSIFASKEEGLFLPPKENDEVVVGFWQGDWSQPIIIGSVHNPKNKGPFEYNEKNEKRGLVLKEAELSFLFDEKEKHIQSKTGKKLEITLSDKEGHKHKYDSTTFDIMKDIDLSADNVGLKTAKGDAKFDIKGKFKISAKGGTDVS